MADIYTAHRETRDNLGSQDENKNLILLGPYKETLGVEMGPTQLVVRDVGTAFILGHSGNGILGTSALGIGTMTAFVVNRVVNPANIFHEHFRFSNFNDTTNTTGTFSTTYYNVNVDEDEIYQTLDIFKDLKSIQFVTIFVDLTGSKSTITVDDEGGQTVTLTEGQ